MELNCSLIARTSDTTDTLALIDQYLAYIRYDVTLCTYNNRKYILLPFARSIGMDVTQITPFDIDAYILQRAQKDKPTTISTIRQVLRSFFQYCEEYREINLTFHWTAIKRKKVKPPRKSTFTREEVQTVVDGCKHRQDALMIALLFFTGMRISELIDLRVDDIHLLQIHVRGKGSYDRVVHIPERFAKELRLYLSLRTDGTYVFRPLQKHRTHRSDKYTSAYAVRDRIEREFKNTLGKDMHPHQLRHSFAIDWLMRGGDLRTLQIILGHDSIETTQLYLGLTDIQTGDIYARVFA